MYVRPISLTSSPLTPAPHEDANNEDDSGSRTASELSATGNDATKQTSDTSTQMQGPPRVNDEEEMDISTACNDGAQVEEEGSDITQAQEQQNQLLEHLQSVSYERDALTEKVTRLLTQLTEVEERQRADCEKKEANKSFLVELRHNVARLLLRYVPLELDQVNYECNVIDEILEQYLCSVLSSNSSTSH
ncbi:unnamed protein product [Merluccius merluccius]